MAQTRASSSVASVLEDFALGQFAFCGLSVQKTGDTLSKVGDSVTYNITITNTGMARLYKDDIEDSLVGDITINGVDQDTAIDYVSDCGAFLEPGASCTITYQRLITADDVSPVENTVNVNYNSSEELNGEGVSFEVTDNHDVELFVPSVRVDKGGPATAQVGDSVTYTFKVKNTSTPGSPALILDTITDPLIGTLTIPASCNSLAVGVSCNFTAARTVLAGDPDPLVNTVTVHYHPLGFPNDIVDTDDHRIDIVIPYGQDPDDDDLVPENPYDNSGGNGPTLGDTAGNTDQTGTPAPAAPATPEPVVENNVVTNDPAPAPVSLDQLPRTGLGLDRLAAAGGLLVILGSLILASRRRRPNQA
jgi:uncharacterized repeat protein (TIGR01451 family)